MPWAVVRGKCLARGVPPGPRLPGWIQEEPHCPLAGARSRDRTGSPPPSAPSPLGDPSSAAGPRCRPLPPHVCAARVFLGRRAASHICCLLHEAQSTSREGPRGGSGESLQAIRYNFLLIIRAKGGRER